jgi:drug/metabolite transporter (DMT)-like permease
LTNHWKGFYLSLLTAFMWGVLPIFIKLCLQVMDSATITWYRFAFSGAFIFLLLTFTRALPAIRKLSFKPLLLVMFAGFALVINYFSNVEALDYIDPETVQVLMQLAPFLLMLGGVFIYQERFSKLELSGAVLLIAGLLVFFNKRFLLLFDSLNSYNNGVWLAVVAALFWAAYALVQKVLLRSLTAKQLTMLIYLLGVVVLLPFTKLSDILQLNSIQAAALLFCCINTIVAYGAFTEALNIWSASKVGAMIALAPLFTFASTAVAEAIMPEYFSATQFDNIAYLGAAMVVIGSIVASFGKQRQ